MRDIALEMNTLGITCSVAALEPTAHEFASDVGRLGDSGVRVWAPLSRQKRLTRLRSLKQYMARERPDVIFAHSTIPSLYTRSIAALFRTPTVHVIHSGGDDYESQYLRFLETIVPAPAEVIAVSDETARRYTQRFRKAVVQIVQNGIRLERYRGGAIDRAQKRLALGCSDPNCCLMIQVGRISRLKRQRESLAAFIRAKERGMNAQLLLIGPTEEPDYEELLERDLEASTFHSSISLLGSRSDIAEILAAADLFLMPSEYEAQSIALLEALASGVSILASNIPDFSHLEQYGGTALTHPENVEEYSLAMLAQNQLRRFGGWTRNMSDFSIQSTVKSYVRIAERICKMHTCSSIRQ